MASPGRVADRVELWSKYKQEQRCWTEAFGRDGHHTILDPGTDTSMTFFMQTIGKKPGRGYPLYITLHGGGGCPKEVNDGQYVQMQEYWTRCVDSGVYVACRGITNTWKLHWEEASFSLYDRIIEAAITEKEIDSNRVYIMGYSAGGDGVYRIIPVMPDRFAAANMCAGHPNGVSVVNMMHVPMLLQVGECDASYNRHKVTAEYGKKLADLNHCYPHSYKNEVRIHGKAHHSNIKDWGKQGLIVANSTAWLEEGARNYKSIACDSVAWVNQHSRNPAPRVVKWEPHQPKRVSRSGVNLHSLHFWLDISGGADPYDNPVVEVSVDVEHNTIRVHKTGTWLKLLLDERLVKIDQPVMIEMDAQSALPAAELTVKLDTSDARRSLVMKRTLYERGDPEFVFETECILNFSGEEWEAHTSMLLIS